MEFKIETKTLKNTLKTFTTLINNQITLPILTGIKIIVNHDKIIFLASDGYIAIEKVIDNINLFKVTNSFEIVIKFKIFFDIINSLNESWINFKLIETNIIKIYTKNDEFEINLFNLDDFPKLSFSNSNENNLTIKNGLFKKEISKIIRCSSEQTIKNSLTGININSKNNFVTFIATDMSRIGIAILDKTDSSNFEATISSNTAKIITKLIDNDNEKMSISINEQRLLITFEKIKLRAKIIDEKFPIDSIEKIKNLEYKNKILIKTTEILNMLERAMSLKGITASIPINIEVLDKKMIITSKEYQIGVVRLESNEFKCEGLCNLTVSLNALFLYEAIKDLSNPDQLMHLEINNNEQPIKVTNSKNKDTFVIILPIRQ